jgi:20S proteasome alpha/beta subunit
MRSKMGRERRKSKIRKINPTFYVFCEGETEKEYINYLRSRYRVPIEIKSKISGNKISQRFITSYLSDIIFTKDDKIFLFYDEDVTDIIDKLKAIKNGQLLLTNPCIE